MASRDTPQERALQGAPFNMEFIVEEGGVSRWFEANSQPVSDTEGRLQSAIIVIRDITERSLHRLQEQFLSLASHELRTPLTSLSGYLQALDRSLRNGNAGERAQRYTGNALIQVDRLNRLIGDLVDVVRLQTGKYTLDRRPLDLAELVERVVETVRLLTDREISLIGTDGALRVNGDAGRLEQVLSNLLTNAITHAPETARTSTATSAASGRRWRWRCRITGRGSPPPISRTSSCASIRPRAPTSKRRRGSAWASSSRGN